MKWKKAFGSPNVFYDKPLHLLTGLSQLWQLLQTSPPAFGESAYAA